MLTSSKSNSALKTKTKKKIRRKNKEKKVGKKQENYKKNMIVVTGSEDICGEVSGSWARKAKYHLSGDVPMATTSNGGWLLTLGSLRPYCDYWIEEKFEEIGAFSLDLVTFYENRFFLNWSEMGG